jgi:hypothetical protein
MLAGGRGGNQDLLARAAHCRSSWRRANRNKRWRMRLCTTRARPSPSQSSTVTLGVGEERPGVDMQLRLVHTAVVEGSVQASTVSFLKERKSH